MNSFVIMSLVAGLMAMTYMVTGRTLQLEALSRQKRQNYDALLQNKAFVESQINCVLGRGHCDRIGSRIKIIVPEVIQTKECKSCTDDERGNVQKVADHVKNHYPKAWNEIKDQYTEDPTNAAEYENTTGGSQEEDSAESIQDDVHHHTGDDDQENDQLFAKADQHPNEEEEDDEQQQEEEETSAKDTAANTKSN